MGSFCPLKPVACPMRVDVRLERQRARSEFQVAQNLWDMRRVPGSYCGRRTSYLTLLSIQLIIDRHLMSQGASVARIAYFRVSTLDQSVESQRHALLSSAGGHAFDREFKDEGVSGSVPAASRPGFVKLLSYVREEDTVHVYAVDRLGRDALDVQTTVRRLIERGISVDVHGLGRIGKGVGELILAVLAQVADLERCRIRERTAMGRARAVESLAQTGRTHRGKKSLGRPLGRGKSTLVEPAQVVAWRASHKASIAATASHWGLSQATVKRYCASDRIGNNGTSKR